MRITSIFVLFACLFATMSAQAGNMNIIDGRVNWQSTKCTPPKEPGTLPRDPETAANDLNALLALHNQYAEAAQAYMTCVSQEAQADAEASAQGIIKSAQGIIQQTQANVTASAARITKRPQ